ncbi:MAG TPA: RDD family protein [Bacteroidota bacterium]|nr:RDD family protein [Bacteroidota bacterium]
MIKKKASYYDAHSPDRMQQLQGARLASFTARAAAFGTDFLLVVALFLLIAIPGVRFVTRTGLIQGKFQVQFNLENWYSLVVFVAYYALATYWGNGRTIGKMLFRIRVVSLLHERISFWHSVERALGYGASFLEFGFGFLQYFIDANHRTVHDRIAETIVVDDGGVKQSVVGPDGAKNGKTASNQMFQ